MGVICVVLVRGGIGRYALGGGGGAGGAGPRSGE